MDSASARTRSPGENANGPPFVDCWSVARGVRAVEASRDNRRIGRLGELDDLVPWLVAAELSRFHKRPDRRQVPEWFLVQDRLPEPGSGRRSMLSDQ